MRRFAMAGAIGCLVGALVGELLLLLTFPEGQPVTSSKPPVDVVFVLDATGSMQGEIDGVRRGIAQFVGALQDYDAQVGLIAFRDLFEREEPQILRFSEGVFTADTSRFSEEMGAIRANGGGDDPESSLDALALAAKQPFRDKAAKILVLITDAPPKVPDKTVPSVEAIVEQLRGARIDQLHLIIQESDYRSFEGLRNAAPGERFALSETANRGNFALTLPTIGSAIAKRLPPTPGHHATDLMYSLPRLVLSWGLWTAAITMMLYLALVMTQNRVLGKPLLTSMQALWDVPGSFLLGFGIGALGQLVFTYASRSLNEISADVLARSVVWVILGSLIAAGVSLFIPNLKRRQAALAGALGGACGGVGFIVFSHGLSDVPARILGAACLGLFIGLVVAMAEAIGRRVWLKIHYGMKETSAVSLGCEPVSVGGDSKQCTVFAFGAPPVALRYKVFDGKVECTDMVRNVTTVVAVGDRRDVGNVTVEVCAR